MSGPCMRVFKDFLDALDTPGGHILVAVILGIFGIGVTFVAEYYMFMETAKAAAMLTGFLSIAAYAMRGQEKANGKTIIVTPNDPYDQK